MTEKVWLEHEIVGGPNDGKFVHAPCREDGITIWFEIQPGSTVSIDSEVMITSDTQFRKFKHVTDEKGKHKWEIVLRI